MDLCVNLPHSKISENISTTLSGDIYLLLLFLEVWGLQKIWWKRQGYISVKKPVAARKWNMFYGVLFISKFLIAFSQNQVFLIVTQTFSKTNEPIALRFFTVILYAIIWFLSSNYFLPLLTSCFISKMITMIFWLKNHYLCSNVCHFVINRYYQNRLW